MQFQTCRNVVFMWCQRYNFPWKLCPASLLHALTVLRGFSKRLASLGMIHWLFFIYHYHVLYDQDRTFPGGGEGCREFSKITNDNFVSWTYRIACTSITLPSTCSMWLFSIFFLIFHFNEEHVSCKLWEIIFNRFHMMHVEPIK